MQRSYSRLERINVNNGDRIGNTEARDATEDFFNQAYHFKDWLKKDRSINLLEDVEDYINTTKALSLAADYCNAFKHAGLDRAPRLGKTLDKLNTHVRLDFLTTGPQTASILEIHVDGKGYNSFELATSCVDAWELFLKRNSVVFPEP